jgi:hypothetical protein
VNLGDLFVSSGSAGPWSLRDVLTDWYAVRAVMKIDQAQRAADSALEAMAEELAREERLERLAKEAA